MTRAERLHRVVAKIYPAAAEQHCKDGSWVNDHPSPGQKMDPDTQEPVLDANDSPVPARHSGAPYLIEPVDPYNTEAGVAVKVRSADGDVASGRGTTIDEALLALETKLGIIDEGGVK